ncbi:cyclic nucleotide-binding domain-containing protein [Clostridium sp. YIM B02505]|uniref:Cyclic nucleotide-binding domain-containing protein n=1 Tax=Clostridium yunnanense TaxID=2800325 RepID=A0ABS1EVE1_9CLOT|nr:cyclic nucleotide-binding domain-containing protein [Clostridium yunnanense]MBK1813332.1 cyclic nucleotide-binding domain-containing protein [Clostridium yunnanense]
MKRILNKELLNDYFTKNNIENIFDKDIINCCELHFYKKDEFVLHSESELEYLYMLVDGKLKIFYLFENGKSMLLKFYKDFIFIGDIEILKNKPIRCNVEAVEDTYLIAVPANIIRKYYIDNTKFLHYLIDSLSEKLDSTINNSSYNFVYPLSNRLASYLIEHLTEEDNIVLDSSFKEIAQFLGTTTRHLGRTFKELEAKNVIRLDNKTVYILDRIELNELSKNTFLKSL